MSIPPQASSPDVSGSSSGPVSGGIDLDIFLRMAVAQGVSDIHVRAGAAPVMRKDGDMLPTKMPPLSELDIQNFAKSIIPEKTLPRLKNRTDFDFSFMLDNSCRFRVNLFYEMGRLGLVMRLIPLQIPTLDDLGHPPVISRFADLHKGLVLVTGPTGSGKSTTLAALLNTINRTRYKHIVTLEDPVEYVYQSDKSVVTQRQLGMDTDTFPNGIKYALRQDPDVILIGEMRDRETMMAALHAAETGHVVFSTLHTTDSVQTINRIINAFEPYERDSIRNQLAGVLQGTVSQRLVKKAEGKGRVAVSEVMVVSPAIRDYILRDEMGEIYQLLNNAEFEGAHSLNHSLHNAFRNGLITPEDALETSENPTELQQMLRGAFHGSSTF
ncbi:type IV pilus twitching motility protein PilT [Vampirovibrio chlorellavorus]|uniref:type IV pilus twitching motility protein PilT n=1 Tax=Vampirovibrio chlorellavorus TaxID=758823 RepID=UPI0026EC1C42|nr:type IV pilus twitching motility protein PilT [Vampirovibrio chlorellavorus]